MIELFKILGFKDNPFSRFSAEEEVDYLEDIFNPPKYYQTIYSDIKDGASRFILGERGIGKSALMFKLIKQFKKDNVFTVLIDQYDNIKMVNNNDEFLIEILNKLVTQFSIMILKNKHLMGYFNKEDKEKFAFFISLFFESLSKSEFQDIYDKATNYKIKNFWRRIFNIFLKPVNYTLSDTSEYLSSTVCKALGLNYSTNQNFYKKYIPELKLEKLGKKQIDKNELKYSRLKKLLQEFALLVKKLKFTNTVVFFDKIDEYPLLKGNIKNIANFIKELVNDTSLLQTQNISLVFLIWSKVRKELNNIGIRFDKFKPIDITWTNEELKSIINKRLGYFSNNSVGFSNIIDNQQSINTIFSLANKSPRHLIMLLSKIYDEQAIINPSSHGFCQKAIDDGILKFIRDFDYSSLYPGKITRSDYIERVIDKMLRVGKIEFEVKDLVSVFKISSQSANSQIQIMRGYALINEIDNPGFKTKKYKIIDPKVKYLIDKNILNLHE